MIYFGFTFTERLTHQTSLPNRPHLRDEHVRKSTVNHVCTPHNDVTCLRGHLSYTCHACVCLLVTQTPHLRRCPLLCMTMVTRLLIVLLPIAPVFAFKFKLYLFDTGTKLLSITFYAPLVWFD